MALGTGANASLPTPLPRTQRGLGGLEGEKGEMMLMGRGTEPGWCFPRELVGGWCKDEEEEEEEAGAAMHGHQAWHSQWGWQGTSPAEGVQVWDTVGGLSPQWGDGPHSGHPPRTFALQGAFWGLMAGLVLGLARMGLELAYPVPRCGVPDRRPWLLADIHYLHFAVLLCAITGAVVVGGSLLTPPLPSAWVSRAPGTPHPGPHGCVHPPDLLGRRRRCHPGAPRARPGESP